MKAFLDTSSLLKLYHQEADTDELSKVLADVGIIYRNLPLGILLCCVKKSKN